MMLRNSKIACLLAAVASAASPAAAADPADVGEELRPGVVAGLAVRLPLGPKAAAPRAGLKLSFVRQSPGEAIPRLSSDAIEFGYGSRGPALYVAGIDATAPDAFFRATADGERRFPWRTVGLVLGAVTLAGGLYFAHVVHEENKNSE